MKIVYFLSQSLFLTINLKNLKKTLIFTNNIINVKVAQVPIMVINNVGLILTL